MKEKHPVPGIIFLKILTSVLLILLSAASCMNRIDKTDNTNLIPEKEFVSILTDIYIANSVLTLPEIRTKFALRDSVLNYIDVIKSHGYSYEQMNGTMNYYFVSKPKKLIKIYDQIIGRMSELESGMQSEILRKADEEAKKAARTNIYYFPDPGRQENPVSSIIIKTSGTYTITLSVTIFPDDMSYNPHLSSYLVDADSADTGKKIWLPSIKYIKDGNPHQIIYSDQVLTKRPMIMKTVLLDYENNITELDRHARVEMVYSNFTSIR